VRDNRQAFQRLRLVPRVMVNVANIDLTYELLGRFPETKSVQAVCTLLLHISMTLTSVCVKFYTDSMVAECLRSKPGPAGIQKHTSTSLGLCLTRAPYMAHERYCFDAWLQLQLLHCPPGYAKQLTAKQTDIRL